MRSLRVEAIGQQRVADAVHLISRQWLHGDRRYSDQEESSPLQPNRQLKRRDFDDPIAHAHIDFVARLQARGLADGARNHDATVSINGSPHEISLASPLIALRRQI